MMKTFEPEKIRQFFFIALLTVLGTVQFIYLRSFLPSLLGAITFYVLMRKFMKRMLAKNWKPGLAALMLILISFLIIMLPVIVLINSVSSKIGYVISHATELTGSFILFLRNIETRFGYQLLNEETIRNLSGLSLQKLPLILGATFNSLVVLTMMYFILYYMLIRGNKMEDWLEKVLPLRKDNIVHVQRQMNRLVISNAVGIPLVALLQGVSGLILYLILGIREPILWFALTAFTSMLPIIGSPLAYVPLALIQMAHGETGKGIIIIVYGLVVIGTVDNVLRIWLQKLIGDVHPLITIFGVFVGVPLFGFIGLVFGPLLISLFFLLMRIYRVEFIAPEENLGGD
ncbi:MAG TPA: AI-2E family transporter [Chitinophagaceae bacterium]|jgi:predicted PurR-regulated permease PerM|nr:AI-2E family transporter [Chitinophagaceae bacterium]